MNSKLSIFCGLVFFLLTLTSTAQDDIKKTVLPELNNVEVPRPLEDKMTWGDIDYHGNPWVSNASLPYSITHGLQGRHLTVNPSHGRYFDMNSKEWLWQRPALYCTLEDVFTMSFAVPFLYPMLENAGAIVATTRERCWMREEVIVDNDAPTRNGAYIEQGLKYQWQPAGTGFAWNRDIYHDGENPFTEGTSRSCEAQNSKRMPSTISWIPNLPKNGEYAVYVSYPTSATNVPDAQYTVRHRGIATTIKVNQQMGGGTWVYLGTFDFATDNPKQNYVALNNISNYRGTVSADAVRFGGGMGNIARADTTKINPKLSGLPRYLEAARYTAQWYGFPQWVYDVKEGTSDYGDDINVRGLASNYLGRGSVYLPGDSGVSVPIELCLAMHSDAGYNRNQSFVGSLGIYTTDFEEGVLPSGVSRKTSGELSDGILNEAQRELQYYYGTWPCRENRNKNYGETRTPRVPSVIFEMFSHQNFADIRLGHDPNFKFRVARAAYKAILRFVSKMHGIDSVVVEPLPIKSFAAEVQPLNNRVHLSWTPENDPLEPSATPTSYVVYQRQGEEGWDNGTVIQDCGYDVDVQPNMLYRFKVKALNAGGASMPSEELCACLSDVPNAKKVLLVNGFQRLAAPYSFDNDSCRGFLMNVDPGVPYRFTPEYCGPQRYFNKDGFTREVSNGLGFSSQEWIGTLTHGNTFDYPSQTAEDILSAGKYTISSCNRYALEEGALQANAYQLMDIIMGLQRRDGYSMTDYKTFSTPLCNVLEQYTAAGGSILCSGAYIGTDMATPEERSFTQRVMHYETGDSILADTLTTVEGMNSQCTLNLLPNENHICMGYMSELRPTPDAFAAMLYPKNQRSAAVAYKGSNNRSISLGFPLEQVNEPDVRRRLMQSFLQFLLY